MQTALRIIVTLAALAAAAVAQTVTGTIECHVRDASQAAIPNAEVSVRSEETGLERSARTNHEGYAQLTFLPVGAYSLTVAAKGFAPQTRQARVGEGSFWISRSSESSS